MGKNIYCSFFILSILLILSTIHPFGFADNSSTTSYTIADPTGDWGFPSPYGMYSRGPGYVRMSFIFDTLIWKDQEGLVSGLAKDWKYIPEENAYIFNLRDNVTWHDGKKFTAEDVVFTFSYIKNHLWEWVNLQIVDRVEKNDNYRVKLYLNKPYAPFLSNIAGTLPMLPKHIWENNNNPEDFRDKKAVVGTGPYKLIDYNKAQGTYLYEAYDGYYLGRPEVDRIKFIRINAEITPIALQRGIVNAASIPPEILEKIKRKGFEIEEEPPTWAAKLIINHKKEPLSSKQFRKALAYAINREQIVQIARRGYAVLGSPGLIPPSNKYWHNPNIEQYNHEPDKAKSIIENLGYSMEEDGYYQKNGKRLEFELLIGAVYREEFGRVGELIKNDLKEVGIKIELRSLEPKSVDARLKNWNFELAVSGHGGLGGDPEILNRVIIGKGFNSARYYKNDKLVELLKTQIRQMNNAERRNTVYKIQEIYADELPAITLYHPKWYWAHDGKIDIYYTKGGLASGIPIPINKLCFLKY